MKKKWLQPTKMLQEARASKGHPWWLEVLIFVLVFFVTQTLVSIPVVVATVVSIFTSDTFKAAMEQATAGNTVDVNAVTEQVMGAMPDWILLVQLFSTALATAGTILYCRFLERRSLSSMGLHRRHAVREYAIGVGVGILLISLCVGFCMLTGSLTLAPSAFSPVMWVLFLIGFVIQGMSEEVVCRGYMMMSVSRRSSLLLAVLTNSIVFSLLHLMNPGFGPLPFLNIVLFGILESVYVLKRGDLWGACAIHSLWNFFQGNVFGISVSGTGAGSSPLTATMTEGWHKWLNGGDFGLEGGLAVTLVTTVAILTVLFLVPAAKDEAVAEPAPRALPEETNA